MTYLHTLAVAFDQLATWQQIGIGAVLLACVAVALGTGVIMLEIVGRSVDSASEHAMAGADRISAEAGDEVFITSGGYGYTAKPLNRQYTRDEFRAESRARLKQQQASLRGQRRMK